jgi:hypothetical protein
MKNQSFAYLLLVGFGILSSCVNVTNNSYATDDLYDESNRSVQVAKVQAAKAVKQKKYLDFQDLQESDVEAEVIEEEEGLAQESFTRVNPNLYQSAYQQGLSDGLFNSPYMGYGYRYTPFNYWNPGFSTFGSPFRSLSIGIGVGVGFSAFSPYSFYDPFNPFFDPYYGSFYSPFYSPFYNPYGFNNYGFNHFYRNYNFYSPGGFYNGFNGQNQQSDVREKRNFGPREDRSNNRNTGGNYTNSPRGGNNSYNTQGNILPRVNTQQAPAKSGSSTQPYVAPRRNTNYEYREAPVDGGTRTNSNASPSYSSPSSSGGNSSSGSSGGGSSRGPR